MKDIFYIENIGKIITKSIVKELERVGILFRVFLRIKSEESIEKKISIKGYGKSGSKLTDILGLRIILYFKDDVNLVYKYLKSSKYFDHEAIEETKPQIFKPERLNLTFKFEDEYITELLSIIGEYSDRINTTYEIQLRTVLSEGWHEVEHDLRYKSQKDWEGHEDLLRNLNGLFATLDTCDFTMLKIFDSLSDRHYNNKNYSALIKSKFRLRFKSSEISDTINDILLKDSELCNNILCVNRELFLERFLKSKISIPLTIDNLIHILNHLYFKNDKLFILSGDFINDEIKIGLTRE